MEAITVVLADDHPVLREGMRNLLEQQRDITVVGEAGNGHEAVAAVRALQPDIVLMDVVMPRLNGIEATKQIKKTNPTTAVLILSAYDDDRYVLGLLDAGAAGYLLKNATGQEVIQAIRSVHAGEAVLHPAVAARLLARAGRISPRHAPVDSEEPLTGRELEVLQLAAKGHSNKEIAKELVLSVPTVKAHLVNIFNKLGVGSRTEAVLYGLRMGWLVLEEEA
ncbi:MAG: response regulator transcription factor [Dehalococcoidia bacterium]|nr:MAG: response regulator transcription factor [Dehalococcoidia bacterium]